jgi:hypothetical protein
MSVTAVWNLANSRGSIEHDALDFNLALHMKNRGSLYRGLYMRNRGSGAV